MALPRPVLLAILGVALVLAALLATRAVSGEDGGATVTATPAAPRTTPAPSDPARPQRPAPPARATNDPGAPAAERVPVEEPGASNGLPVSLARALAGGKVLMLVFTSQKAADDEATRRSVQAIQKKYPQGRRVVVVRDRLANLADYRLLISGVGVSQTPSIVVMRADREPRLLEGFIDEGTLRQHVADALR